MTQPLFTPRFFAMCAFTFTVFLSLFQLLPTAPYHVIALGGSTTAAGLFLGLLTYSSALSAPFTGSVGDRIGQRRVLFSVSLVLAGFSAAYAFITDYRLLLALVVVHGFVWSALLTASGAYITAAIPVARRAQGLSYWGLASVFSIALAPPLGFWVYQWGWWALCVESVILNLCLAVIAWRLPDDRALEGQTLQARRASGPGPLIEVRALVLAIALGLVAFGYGGMTSFSAMFADSLGVRPRSVFLTAMAAAIAISRIAIGRRLDKVGYRTTLLPALGTAAAGLMILAVAQGTASFILAASIFGAGFGLMFPAFAAYMMSQVDVRRHGATYGAMIAAFDTGIGTGSTTMGWLIDRLGFREAIVFSSVVAFASIPYFLFVEKRFGFR